MNRFLDILDAACDRITMICAAAWFTLCNLHRYGRKVQD